MSRTESLLGVVGIETAREVVTVAATSCEELNSLE
jgi:hypothetical protein